MDYTDALWNLLRYAAEGLQDFVIVSQKVPSIIIIEFSTKKSFPFQFLLKDNCIKIINFWVSGDRNLDHNSKE